MPAARHSQRSRARIAPYGVVVPRFKIETTKSGAPAWMKLITMSPLERYDFGVEIL
jgi:hypothetical protein